MYQNVVCPPIFTKDEHVFPNVELIFNKLCLETTVFTVTVTHKIILLFSDLIFPNFSPTDRKFPDFSMTFW